MRAFLTANDPAVTPGYTLHKPVLIVQGNADTFVLEPLQTPFADRLKASGAPVTYKVYEGADHFSVIRQADADVLAFLRQSFAR
jgi:alpha-beta hydrolase superfamily lysophospholipase